MECLKLHRLTEIVILNVENPNKFWFRTIDHQTWLDEALKSYLTIKSVEKNFIPKKNDVIIAKIQNNFKIVRVKKVINEKMISISTLETGEIWNVDRNNVIQLSGCTIGTEAINSIFMGSVSEDIVPAMKKFNHQKSSADMTKMDAWSNESIADFKEILERSSCIEFFPTHSNKSCYFGELTFRKSISDMLLNMEHAMRKMTACEDDSGANADNKRQLPRKDKKSQQDDHNLPKPIKKPLSPISERTEASEHDELCKSFDAISIDDGTSVLADKSTELADDADKSFYSLILLSDVGEEDQQINQLEIDQLELKFDENGINKTVLEATENDGNLEENISDTSVKLSSEVVFDSIESNEQIQNNNDIIVTSNQSKELPNGDNEIHSKEVKSTGTGNDELDDSSSSFYSLKTNDILPIGDKNEESNSELLEKWEQDDDKESVCSNIPSYMYVPSDSEEEPELYEYSAEKYDEMEKKTDDNIMKIRLQHLLKDAKLSEREPTTYSINPIEPFEQPASCDFIDEVLSRPNESYSLPRTVRPYITNGRSIILIGEADFYPHLLYLPPICAVVENEENVKTKGPQVVILATSCQQANDIHKLNSCYLRESFPSRIYSSTNDYSNEEHDEKFEKCKIFITTVGRVCNQLDGYFPETVKCVVVNNLDLISADNRQKIIMFFQTRNVQMIFTSERYVEQISQIMKMVPDIFVSVESFIDLYYLTAKENELRSTDVVVFESRLSSSDLEMSKWKIQKLRSKLNAVQPSKVVVVCVSDKDAQDLAGELDSKYNIRNIVNQTPKKGSPNILVCSDDRLIELNVRSADHILHYELPDDFNTFSLRYSVLARFHCTFQNMNSSEEGKKPSSTIMFNPRNASDKKTMLMLTLISREYKLNLTQRHKNSLLKVVRNRNANAPLCVDVAASFTDFNHMLKCKNRHFFPPEHSPKQPTFTQPTLCQIEVLCVISPALFTVRIIKCKNANGDWCELNASDSFDKFHSEFNEFYGKSFAPIQNDLDINKNVCFVVREVNNFSRCKIIEQNVEGAPGMVRVKLLDFGKFRAVKMSDIGYMEEMHATFPIQSTNLCILNIAPWNRRYWDNNDTEYISRLFSGKFSDDEFGKGLFEVFVQSEIPPDLIFVKNLFQLQDAPNRNINYVDFITSRNIATNHVIGLQEFFQHAKDANVVAEDPWPTIKNALF